MRLTFENDEREVLKQRLGLAPSATDAELTAAVQQRFAASAPAPAHRAALRSGSDLVGTLDTADRDSTIDAAIRDGKFAAARADHYRAMWDADPSGTRRTIARLQTGVVDPLASADSAYPREWLRPAPQPGGSRIHGTGD